MDENIKREWEEKIRQAYGDSGHLLKFMSETLENFAYRYISTADFTTPKLEHASEKRWVIRTLENSMVNALKVSNPTAKEGIKQLAKTVPHAQKPTVQYELVCEIFELKADQGKVTVTARINWNYPSFEKSNEQQVAAHKTLQWSDLQVFRKEFPLAVQEVCDLFL